MLLPRDPARPIFDGGSAISLLPQPGPEADDGLATVAAARLGVSSAWTSLFRRYNPLVVATARRYGLNPAECEDAAQTTWMSLFENIDQLRADAALGGWLVTTAAREAQRSARRRSRETPTDEMQDQPQAGGPDVVDMLARRGTIEAMRRCIGRLSERERDLVESLLDPQEPSYRQISIRLGMPIGSIGPTRRRALRKLHTLLTEEEAVS